MKTDDPPPERSEPRPEPESAHGGEHGLSPVSLLNAGLLGSVASFCLFFTVASRWIPVVNVSEENEEKLIGKKKQQQVELKS